MQLFLPTIKEFWERFQCERPFGYHDKVGKMKKKLTILKKNFNFQIWFKTYTSILFKF